MIVNNIKWDEMKKTNFVTLLFIDLFTLVGCSDISEKEYIQKQIHIDMPEPINISYIDTHGGFHGDGKLFAKLEFSFEDKESIVEKFKSDGNWYFLDHNSEGTYSSSDIELFNRSSFNLTTALYDADTNVLYYLEFDT